MKKAVITGGTGVLGQALVNELISKDITVLVICRPNSKYISYLPNHKLVSVLPCDINNLHILQECITSSYNYFYHLGWDGTYGESRQNLNLQMQNVFCTLQAVELAYKLGCNVFIGAGSQSEYGDIKTKMSPTTPCQPNNGYGVAKLCAFGMSKILCKQLGIRHNWCRILSIYGPYDKSHTMIMSSIVKMIKGEKPQFTLGNQIWDYIYSKDAAQAFSLVAEKGIDGHIYCIGSGKSRLLREYIYAMRNAVDPSLDVGIGEIPYYENQAMHLEADISNLTKDTGFAAQTSFEDGIRETIEWVKQHYLKDTVEVQ